MNAERSYRQYCGLARTLDVVGDRWSLLIVRELLPGPRRYRDLARSLGAIASNLLTDRLRRLETSGILQRQFEPSGAVVYALTAHGSALREPIEALVRWSTPLMMSGQRDDDAFDPRWLAIALPALLGPALTDRPIEFGLEVRGSLLAVLVDENGVHVEIDPAQPPAPVLAGEPDVILGWAAGVHGVDHPALTITGDERAFQAIRRPPSTGGPDGATAPGL